MEQNTIDKILLDLEKIRLRPTMCFGHYEDFQSAVAFFIGFNHALILLNQSLPAREIYNQIYDEKGYKWSPNGVVTSMKEKSLSNEEIVIEIVSIEIEAWKRFRTRNQI